VTILLGNGSGGFSEAGGSPVAVGTNPVPVAFGNWNADGKLDLAVANFSSSNVTILLNSTASAPDGTACNDSNACTTSDSCVGGACTGTPVPAPADVPRAERPCGEYPGWAEIGMGCHAIRTPGAGPSQITP